MAGFDFTQLKTKYQEFQDVTIRVFVGGENGSIGENKMDLGVNDVTIENTCGYEASVANFAITGAFSSLTGSFDFEDVKKYILLGSTVVIFLGYAGNIREVFRGFISSVNFEKYGGEVGKIRVTALDIKGIMMSGSYSRQLKANCYSEAVKEILKRSNYESIISSSMSSGSDTDYDHIITDLKVADTPDAAGASGGAAGAGDSGNVTDKTIEMVAESDYEFVVKAAKKFNFEFFSVGGTVYFRPAKEDTEELIELGPNNYIRDFNVEYNISGLVSSVEVRGTDVGKAELISQKKKLSNKISNGSKAKSLISGIEKVYIDPTIHSKEEAGYRAAYLAEDISYRLGTMQLEMVGLPELTPGKFMLLNGIGYRVKFYITSVVHILNGEDGYRCKVIGKASSVEEV